MIIYLKYFTERWSEIVKIYADFFSANLHLKSTW